MVCRSNVSIMDESSCSGCGLCSFVCPMRCVEMKENERGFILAAVGNNCIACGKCLADCPSINPPVSDYLDIGLVAQSGVSENLVASTGGGMHLHLANSMMALGGVSYGAAFSDEWVVEHIECHTAEEVMRCRGSKYVQSSLTNKVFASIKKNLEQNIPVLFTGLPCQTAAVKTAFGDNASLFLVDLVCHGVASPMAWRQYLSDMQFGRIESIRFRNKTYGYHMSTMRVVYESGVYSKSGRIDPYLRAFFSGIAHRKSCNECKFKGRRRYSDITLFDCGRYCELTGDNDDDLGHTSVLVNTKKGEKLLLELGKEEVVFSAIDRGMGEQLNGKMIEGCTPKHPRSDSFYSQILSNSFSSVVQSYLPIKLSDYCIEAVKGLACKTGILTFLRKAKERKLLVTKH